MEQNLWLAVHRFSFWYWKLGGTVKRTTLYNGNCEGFPDNFQMFTFWLPFLLCLHLQSLELCGSPSGFSGELSNVPPLCRVAGQSLKASKEESCIVSGRSLGADHCQVLYLDEKWNIMYPDKKIKSLPLPREGISSVSVSEESTFDDQHVQLTQFSFVSFMIICKCSCHCHWPTMILD